MSKLADYPFEIRPLTPDEGGGFLISYPDFLNAFLMVKPSRLRSRMGRKH